ncbi:N-methyl-D-aspartate receptor NMDAR2C subunit [Herminiimonas glaciei]|uniref:N-methyl-D-aspartate receptor NMDAR2C subunit n=1 Tax=Herminiimonas glaciei TaxID=523788 RepID=A0ABW2I793_9BURK
MLTASTENQEWLQQKWQALTAAVFAEPAAADAVWKELLRHYSEPQRSYHNLSHVAALLRRAEQQREHIRSMETVEFAIWFHDVIYDTHLKDNEQRSAEWARCAMIAMNIDEYHIPPVWECIVATATHTVTAPEIIDLPLFLDMDLAILGAEEKVYQAYSKAIQSEYAWVAVDDYRQGRGWVIEDFLQRPTLYFTPRLTAELEAQARHNLGAELRALKQT